MNPGELIADTLAADLPGLNGTLADFSDADLLARPVPAANHPAWQLGHMIVSETNAGNLVRPGSMPELPAGFAERFSKDRARSDNAADFPKKADLLAQFEKTRRATVAWVRKLSPQELDAPSPEKLRGWAPTVGRLALALSGHVAMHIGQFQVARRKLGKPVLF